MEQPTTPAATPVIPLRFALTFLLYFAALFGGFEDSAAICESPLSAAALKVPSVALLTMPATLSMTN